MKTRNKNILSLLMATAMLIGTIITPSTANNQYTQDMESILAYVFSQTPDPNIGTTFGEWAILAHVRGGVSAQEWYDKYLDNLCSYLEEGNAHSVNEQTGKVVLHQSKYTENQRVALTLTALGIDAEALTKDETSYNFISAIIEDKQEEDTTQYQSVWQGMNGAAFALIALDSGIYAPQRVDARAYYLNYILEHKTNKNVWSIDGGNTGSDVDVTGMVIQSLAPYYLMSTEDYSLITNAPSQEDLKLAVDTALDWLSEETFTFAESYAQLIIALTALGIDPTTDSRFIDDEKNPIEQMLAYQTEGSAGFSHTMGTPVNQMASEQVACALVAYDRFVKSQTAFYDMSDVFTAQPGVQPITAQIAFSYQEDASGFKIPRVSQTIASNLSEEYGYNDIFAGDKISALDAIVAAHIQVFGEDKSIINQKLTLSSGAYGDFVSNFMGDGIGNMVYYVNGQSAQVGAPSHEIVEQDTVEIFTIRELDYSDLYGWFKVGDEKKESQMVEVGVDLILNLQGNTWEGDSPVEGASVVIIDEESGEFGESLGVTQEDGDITINFTEPGVYILGAVQAENATALMSPRLVVTVTGTLNPADKTALNTLISQVQELSQSKYTAVTWNALQTALTAATTVAADQLATQDQVDTARTNLKAAVDNLQTVSGGGSGSGDTISVTFRLIGSRRSIGDIDLSNGNYRNATYATWIATKSHTLNQGDTVYDLYVKAITEAGLTSKGHEKNYVESIKAPASIGNYTLAELDNGKYSGWMYTLNGKHPGYGLKEHVLQNGDKVIWHYTNDYRYEVEDWFGDDEDSLGDGTYWNKWLDIPDTNPPVTTPTPSPTSTPVGVYGSTGGSSFSSITQPTPEPTPQPSAETTPPTNEKWNNPYGDVSDQSWFYESVKFVTENGIMQGIEQGNFDPDGMVTRAMLVTMLYRYSGAEAGGVNPFSDISEGQWYTDAVIWGAGNSIIAGYGDGFFGPDDLLSREQIVVILYRYAEMIGADLSQNADIQVFTDVDEVAPWALEAMKWAQSTGIMKGRSETHLAPTDSATRAEIAALMERFINGY